jgi:hypothetical protein
MTRFLVSCTKCLTSLFNFIFSTINQRKDIKSGKKCGWMWACDHKTPINTSFSQIYLNFKLFLLDLLLILFHQFNFSNLNLLYQKLLIHDVQFSAIDLFLIFFKT